MQSAPPSSARPRRLHIDTDPGLDDLLALALAFASPELDVRGVTTLAGNASLEATSENAQRFLALVGADVPLGRGAAGPLALSPLHAEQFHGEDGRRGVSIPAVDRRPLAPAADVLRRSLIEEEVEAVVALGPLTNLALLLRESPELLDGIELIWMGGGLEHGNASPVAEFNCMADPVAASLVLEACAGDARASGPRLRVIGLDVTERVRVGAAECRARPLVGSVGRLIADVLDALCEAERPVLGEACAVLHDPCAVLAATGEDLFRYASLDLVVDRSEGPERGRLSCRGVRREAGRIRYATEVRTDRATALFFDRLTAWCRGLA